MGLYIAGFTPTIDLEVGDILNHLNWLRIRISPWIVGIETLDVSHQEEIVGADHSGGNSRKSIIVSEFDFLRQQLEIAAEVLQS